jgi:hypothetical protein
VRENRDLVGRDMETMRRTVWMLSLFLVPGLLAGCVVQSLYPFYKEGSVIAYPQLSGQWRLVKQPGSRSSRTEITPWSFDRKKIHTVDEKGVSSRLRITYFKVGDTVFADVFPDDPDETKINKWWTFHVVPVHSVCKVRVEGDGLTFIPLNYDWLKKALRERELSLSFEMIEDGEHLVFNATSEDWMSFLSEYKDDKSAFDSKNEYVLERVKEWGAKNGR